MSDVNRIISALRETFPGVVEEWEQQRNDGNEDWPDYHTEDGLNWWLDSELKLTEDFIPGDATGQERNLQEFCLGALKWLAASWRETTNRVAEDGRTD
jgi:hypothetical protein